VIHGSPPESLPASLIGALTLPDNSAFCRRFPAGNGEPVQSIPQNSGGAKDHSGSDI
jgi:hypothetical protein